MPLSDLRLRAARARIAAIAAAPLVPAPLGSISLRDEQRRAVGRVLEALGQHGGCILADEVGRGKTYIALAVARRWMRPLVIVPASLRRTWMEAMGRADVHCALTSHESLSRGRLPHAAANLVIVDESHRFRSPAAKRYEALVALTAHAPVLLLSATPLQNRTRDLAAQAALFLGGDAFRRAAHELAWHVIRGEPRDGAALPLVAPPRWVRPACDDEQVLRAILTLPPPAGPIDGGDGGVLRVIGLVRAWASSRAALRATLRRRRRTETAMEQSLAAGLAPTRREIESWRSVGDDVQLAMAPMIVRHAVDDAERERLRKRVEKDQVALARLSATLAATVDPDAARATALRELRAAHPAERILAFSEFASTVRAYFARLAGEPAIGMLTATEARIASGRISRDALIDRFAPVAQGLPGAHRTAEHGAVTLLLTTDLLSEGMNLQDASVVVHLDMPWNPLRLAQRVGRVRRPGGVAIVSTYLLAPPAKAELLLDVESRLRRKLARAERTVGRMLPVMPALGRLANDDGVSSGCGEESDAPSAATLGSLADRVARWGRAAHTGARRQRAPTTYTFVGGVSSSREGWLAMLGDGRLLASLDGRPPDAASLPAAVRIADGPGRPLVNGEGERAIETVRRWIEQEHVRMACGVTERPSPLRESVERRIAATVRSSPRHRRAATLALVARLRDALRGTRPLGAERELAALLGASGDGADWLTRALDIVTRAPAHGDRGTTREIVVVVVLGDASSMGSTAERQP